MVVGESSLVDQAAPSRRVEQMPNWQLSQSKADWFWEIGSSVAFLLLLGYLSSYAFDQAVRAP